MQNPDGLESNLGSLVDSILASRTDSDFAGTKVMEAEFRFVRQIPGNPKREKEGPREAEIDTIMICFDELSKWILWLPLPLGSWCEGSYL